MKRRNFLTSSVVIATSASVLGSSAAHAFGLNSLTGGGSSGGASWKDIAETFTGGLQTIGTAAARAAKSVNNIIDATGLKVEEGLTAKSIKDLENGEVNGDNLADVSASSKSTAEQLKKMSMEKIVLDAEQKKKIAVASADYFKAFVGASKGVLQLVEAKNKASGAGSPGITDGLAAAQAAKDIPVLTPKAIEFFTNSIEVVKALREFNKTNDIAVADTEGLEDAINADFSMG
jgi:hypothetical protein